MVIIFEFFKHSNVYIDSFSVHFNMTYAKISIDLFVELLGLCIAKDRLPTHRMQYVNMVGKDIPII